MANYLQGVGQLPAMSAEVLETGKIPETNILGNIKTIYIQIRQKNGRKKAEQKFQIEV